MRDGWSLSCRNGRVYLYLWAGYKESLYVGGLRLCSFITCRRIVTPGVEFHILLRAIREGVFHILIMTVKYYTSMLKEESMH